MQPRPLLIENRVVHRLDLMPVRRLRPETVTIDEAATRKRNTVMRDKLNLLITARIETAQEQGYAAGLAAARAEIETDLGQSLAGTDPEVCEMTLDGAVNAPGARQL